MLVLMAPLRREISRIQPLLVEQRTVAMDRCVVIEGTVLGTSVALAQCGMGKERSLRAADALIKRYRPAATLSIGYAGGLSPNVRGGDLVLAEHVVVAPPAGNAQHDEARMNQPLNADAGLLRAAGSALMQARIPFHQGQLLTVAEGLGPRAKAQAAIASSACAADMESYWIGRTMAMSGIPFLAVRAASDEMNDPLPDYRRFVDHMGNVAPLPAAAYFLCHPEQLVNSVRLARKASKASASLGCFVLEFMKCLEARPMPDDESPPIAGLSDSRRRSQGPGDLTHALRWIPLEETHGRGTDS